MVLDGLLEDGDYIMSQSQEDGLSQASGSTVTPGGRKRNCFQKDLHLREMSSDDDDGSDDGGSDHSCCHGERVVQNPPH